MKEYYKYILPVSLIIILLAISIKNKYRIENEIEKNEYETICKVSEVSRNRNATHVKYYYFYNGNKYTSAEINESVSQHHLFRFFKVKLSTDKPNYSRIRLDEEVGDTTKLIDAGFRHIIKTKAEYDNETSSYKMIKSDYGFK